MMLNKRISYRNGIPNSHKFNRLIKRKILNNICPTCNGRLVKDLNTHGTKRYWVCTNCNDIYSL